MRIFFMYDTYFEIQILCSLAHLELAVDSVMDLIVNAMTGALPRYSFSINRIALPDELLTNNVSLANRFESLSSLFEDAAFSLQVSLHLFSRTNIKKTELTCITKIGVQKKAS